MYQREWCGEEKKIITLGEKKVKEVTRLERQLSGERCLLMTSLSLVISIYTGIGGGNCF